MATARYRVIGKLLGLVLLYCVWVLVALAISGEVFMSNYVNGTVPVGFIVGYMVLIMAPLLGYRQWQKRTPGWIRKVQDDGKLARATVVEVGSTGITIGRTRSIILVKLRVEPTDGEPFEVIQQKEVSLFGGGYSEGDHLQVKYDPSNKKHVMIVEGAVADSGSRRREQYVPVSATVGHNNDASRHQTSGTNGVVLTDKLAELSSLHKSGELSDAEFDAAKKKLLDQ